MKGQIYPRGKCPKCKKPFFFNEKPPRGFICKRHGIKPDRFRISIYTDRRLLIYSDKQGKTIDSFRRAIDLLKEINAELDAKKFDSSKYIRTEQSHFWLNKLTETFWDEKKNSLRPSYKGDFKRMLDRISEHFGPADVRDLRKPEISDFQKTLSHLSPKTQKNHLDLFKTFLRWVMTDREMIDRLPMFPRIEREIQVSRWISLMDQQKILDLVPAEDRPVIEFCMSYGCRPGEARALRVQDIDWANQTINIHSTFSDNVILERRKGRGAPPLILPIMPKVSPYIQNRLSNALPSAFVFPNPRTGKAYEAGAIRRLWDKIRTLAKIDKSLRFYDATRHSVASNLRKKGADIAAIKDILGHTDIRTTLRYAHADLDDKKTSLELLSIQKVVCVSDMCLEEKLEKIV